MFKRLFGLLIALVVLYGMAWLGAAFWLRTRLDAFTADLRAQEYDVETPGPRFVGFPGKVGLEVRGLAVAAPPSHGGWQWQADTIRVLLSPAAPLRPVIGLSGRHRVTGLISAPDEGVSLVVGDGRARLSFANDRIELVDVSLRDTSLAATPDSAPMLTFGEGALTISPGTRHMKIAAQNIILAHAVPALEKTIASFDVVLDFTGDLPAGPLPASLEAWRAAGGAIEVRSLSLDWPPAAATGNATIALDEALQPMGAATITFRRFFDFVAALEKQGYVNESEGTIAKIVLGMLAKSSAGGTAELSLPLTIQDRRLSAGPVMLMEMPEIVWDEKARVP